MNLSPSFYTIPWEVDQNLEALDSTSCKRVCTAVSEMLGTRLIGAKSRRKRYLVRMLGIHNNYCRVRILQNIWHRGTGDEGRNCVAMQMLLDSVG